MLNVVVVTGRLTADPELRILNQETPVLSCAIAHQRDYKSKDTGEYAVDFFELSAWRKTAEFIANYFRKGSMITVVGKLESRKYTDKDGVNRTIYSIHAEHAYFGDSNRNNKSSDNSVSVPSNDDFIPDFGEENGDEGDLSFDVSFPSYLE